MHHRNSGGMLSHIQEESALIGGFAMVWAGAYPYKLETLLLNINAMQCHSATVLAWRATAYGGGSGTSIGSGLGRDVYYPCAADDEYCIVEEWTFF